MVIGIHMGDVKLADQVDIQLAVVIHDQTFHHDQILTVPGKKHIVGRGAGNRSDFLGVADIENGFTQKKESFRK